MKKKYAALGVVLALFAICVSPADGAVVGGRMLSPERNFTFGLSFGRISSLDGSVEETKRAYTDADAPTDDYDHYLENYTLSDLGFKDSYGKLGLFMEKRWKYITFQLDAAYIHPTSEATARRDYYIGVEEIEYEGKNYEYMKISEGTRFEGDVQGMEATLGILITPFSVTGDSVSMTPWIHLGLMGMFGNYEIDAGPATDLVKYEHHEHDYVVGGKGSGTAGLAVPEIGLGGELRLKLGSVRNGSVHLVLHGEYNIFSWSGGTDTFGVSARNEKEIDISYSRYKCGVSLEIPFSAKANLVMAIVYQAMDADATLEAKDRTKEEQLELVEKYDKKVDFSSSQLSGMVGIQF